MICPFCAAAVDPESPCPHVLLGFSGGNPFGAAAPRYRALLALCIDIAVAFEDDPDSIQCVEESSLGLLGGWADCTLSADGLTVLFLHDASTASAIIDRGLPLED